MERKRFFIGLLFLVIGLILASLFMTNGNTTILVASFLLFLCGLFLSISTLGKNIIERIRKRTKHRKIKKRNLRR